MDYERTNSSMFAPLDHEGGSEYRISSQVSRAIDKFWERRKIDPNADTWKFNWNNKKKEIGAKQKEFKEAA